MAKFLTCLIPFLLLGLSQAAQATDCAVVLRRGNEGADLIGQRLNEGDLLATDWLRKVVLEPCTTLT